MAPKKEAGGRGDAAFEYADVPTPIGTFRIVYRGSAVRLVDLLERGLDGSSLPEGAGPRRPPFTKGSPPGQLPEYFRGHLDRFTLEVNLDGTTAFDRGVWAALLAVPPVRRSPTRPSPGKSGHGGAARAVGGRCAATPSRS